MRRLKLVVALFLLVVLGTKCSQNEENPPSVENPSVEILENSTEVIFTRTSPTTVNTEVNIDLDILFRHSEEYSSLGLSKILLNEDDEEISGTVALNHIAADESTSLSIDSGEALFEGLSFDQDQVEEGHYFRFLPFGILPNGEVEEFGNAVEIFPVYNEELSPQSLETGVYTAVNTDTGFTKDVQILWDDTKQLYYITDFGLDWSKWDDFWYGVYFSLEPGESGVSNIGFPGEGEDTGTSLNMKADNGTRESRELRLMPYAYKEGSSTGTFDPETQKLIFENISVTETWWQEDVKDDLNLEFSKKEEDTSEKCRVVQFVYFVEKDFEYKEEEKEAIEQQALLFQKYWHEQLGVTFYLNDPIVETIYAEHESEWYLESPDGIHSDSRWYRLGNIKNEVYLKLDIEDFDSNIRVVNYPTSKHDGRVGGNFGGAWMDADDMWCISGESKSYPYDDENPAHCLGHVVHEFGHVLGLGHEGPNSDCMQYGFYEGTGGAGMCGFSEENVQQILDDPNNEGWFNALPGDTCN